MNVREALQLASHVAARKSSLPVLSHVLVHGGTITATDITQQVDIPLDMPPDTFTTAFCVHGARLVRILKSLPETEELQMRAVDNRFHIRAGATEFELNTLPAEDFPQMHAPTEAVTSFSVPSAALADAMQFCSPAMGVNDIRYYINAMHLAVSPTQVTLCATDGHRLHRARFPIEEGPEKAASGVIPREAIPSILQIASRHTNVELQLSSTHLGVVDRETLGIRLMETTFPDTQRVIPTGRTVTGSAPRKTLADAIARLSNVFMGEENHPGMRFRFTKDAIFIQAQNVADERGKTTVQWGQADNNLVDTELGLRWDFVTDALKVFSGDTVFVHLGRTDEALYLTDDNEGRHEAVVMPMRI